MSGRFFALFPDPYIRRITMQVTKLFKWSAVSMFSQMMGCASTNVRIRKIIMHIHLGRFNRKCFNAVILALPLIAAGCSFSDSSGSLSDSTSSIVSSPSSVSDKDKKYEEDVSEYTMAYVKSSHTDADYASYQKGLSDIAAKAGINNWDQEPKTYIAIGKGLKKAGLEGIAYETYKKNLANSDQKKMDNIQKGYESKK
jgi:hypothetical protein